MFSQRFVKFVAIKLSAFFLPFVQAFKYYKQALSRLVKRKNNPQIWDAVSWELCTSQYSLGCLLQDYPPIKTTAQEEVIFVHNVFVFIFRAKHLYHWGHCFYASASRKILSSPRTSIYTLHLRTLLPMYPPAEVDSLKSSAPYERFNILQNILLYA